MYEDTESLFGEYPGSSMNFITCETTALALIKPELLSREAELMQTRWFDYRAFHPTKATLFFAHTYTRAHAKRDHIRSGRMRKGYTGKSPFQASPSVYTGFWKARQNADKHGIPYDFYNFKAMKWADERLWRMLPRPQQLYGKELTEYLVEAWDEHQRHAPRLAINTRYLASNYIGHADQVAYQLYLLKTAQRSKVKDIFIGDILARGHLCEAIAIRALGSSQVNRLKALHNQCESVTLDA